MARSFFTGAAVGAMLLASPQLAGAAPAALLGRPAPAQTVNLRVSLPLRNEAQLDALIELQSNPYSPLYHHFLTPAQFRASYGPAPATVARAAAALKAHGFVVTKQTTQSLEFRGAATSVETAFRTKLGVVRDVGRTTRVTTMSPLVVPKELAALGATVTGLEPPNHVHPYSRVAPLNRYANFGPYWFTDLKQAYSYPSDRSLDGKGATVGVLMESNVLTSDTDAAFDHEKYSAISGKKRLALQVETFSGGGGTDGPGFPEASIDVQTSQGSAPGAQIVLYNIPDLSDVSIIGAYTYIVEENYVDVLSNSFGGCELAYTAAYNSGQDFTGVLQAYHELFKQGNAQGITFLASSGDEAGRECPDVSYFSGNPNAHFVPSVGWPADDPNVTAVGGTNLFTTTPPSPQPNPPVLKSAYVSENAIGNAEAPYDPYGLGTTVKGGYWGSGSGSSVIFGKPSYQKLVDTGSRSRAVPDISMQMGGLDVTDSYSLYYVGGQLQGYIGTSLSSPEFAGLLALKIELGKSRLGNVNNYIYGLAATMGSSGKKYYHQGIPGYNGVVTTVAGKSGYNPIIGVGTPYTQNFLGLPAVSLAGNPQTLSNP